MAARFRLLAVDRSQRLSVGRPLVLPAVNHTVPVLRRLRAVLEGQVVVDATIPVLISAGKRRENSSERELLTDTTAIDERAEAGLVLER